MEISTVDLQQKINNGDKVIVEFWAEWCGPCKMMKPVFERVSNSNENGDVQMYTMNIDLNKEVGASLGIRSIPTIKSFSDGREITTQTGVLQEHQLKNLENILVNG